MKYPHHSIRREIIDFLKEKRKELLSHVHDCNFEEIVDSGFDAAILEMNEMSNELTDWAEERKRPQPEITGEWVSDEELKDELIPYAVDWENLKSYFNKGFY